MDEPRYCELCGCVCVACVQLADGCDSCELKHPELISDISDIISDLIDRLSRVMCSHLPE